MIARILSIVLMCSVAAGASGQTTGKPPKKGKAGAKSSAKSSGKSGKAKAKGKTPKNLARKALKLVVENAEFEDMTFEDFVEWLGRETKANVVVRWRIVEKEGVERDAPIYLKQKNITVKKLLPLVFRQVTEELDGVELAARTDGNILLISTRKNLNAKMVVRTYPVRDLLLHIPNFESQRDLIDGRGRGPVAGRRGTGGAGDPSAKLDTRTRKLIEVITGAIEPGSWQINGGRGTIGYFRGRLVIRNSLEVHQRIGGALGDRPKGG